MFAKSKKGSIQFAVKAPAKKAQLVGSFNSWQPLNMVRQKSGSFTVSVDLAPGKYEYKFLLDGQWVADPDHSRRTANAFGTENSVADLV